MADTPAVAFSSQNIIAEIKEKSLFYESQIWKGNIHVLVQELPCSDAQRLLFVDFNTTLLSWKGRFNGTGIPIVPGTSDDILSSLHANRKCVQDHYKNWKIEELHDEKLGILRYIDHLTVSTAGTIVTKRYFIDLYSCQVIYHYSPCECYLWSCCKNTKKEIHSHVVRYDTSSETTKYYWTCCKSMFFEPHYHSSLISGPIPTMASTLQRL